MNGFVPPTIDDEGAPFWECTALGELRVQACASCGLRRFPPRPMCPACHSVASRWDVLSGRGTVWSFIKPHPPHLPEFADDLPFTIVVVALDDDPSIRLIGNLDEEVPVEIGMPVRAVFPEVAPGVHLVRWTVAV